MRRGSYTGVCELCGKNKLAGLFKRRHYKEKHPEIQFSAHSKVARNGKSYVNYSCNLCENGKRHSCYLDLVKHYQEGHPDVDLHIVSPLLPSPAHLAAKTYRSHHAAEPMSLASGEAGIDGFFAKLGEVLEEVKQLRREKREWQLKATRWSARIVELQELMVRKQ